MIYKNRTKTKKKTHRYGTANQRGGGVVIVFNSNEINLVEHKILGNTYELVATTGRQKRSGRHIYLFGVYVLPKMKVGPFQNLMECTFAESVVRIDHHAPRIGGGSSLVRFGYLSELLPG